jgi:hypothetical protein
VVITPSGNFTYFPPAGNTANDSFSYTVSDGTNIDTGTATITFTGRVWYVDNAAALGDGRSHLPFTNLAAAEAASLAGDYIYVNTGVGPYSSGITLQNNQSLIGEGVALVVGPYTLAPAGVRPTIGGVVLGSGNLVAGLNTAASGTGISGSAVTSGTIESVGVTGGTNGIDLSNVAGTFALNNVSIAPGGIGLSVTGTADINATGLTVTTSGATGIAGSGTGTFTITGGTVTTTNGTAVNLSNHDLAIALTAVNATNGVNGINLSNTTGSFAVTGTGAAGSGGTITGTTGVGVNAMNAAGISLASMIIQPSSLQGVLVSNTLSGPSSVTIQNSTVQNSFSTGVQVANGGAGKITVTVNGSTFTSNAGSVIVQTTAGGLDVDITNNVSTFNSSNAFTVNRSTAATGNVDFTFTGNTIGTSGVAGSGAACGGGCSGLAIFALGSGTFNALVDNNVIRQVDLIGIRARSQNSAAMNLTITGNTIAEPMAFATNGINVQSGTVSADTSATCAHIAGNTVTGAWTADIHVRNNLTSANTTFSLPGYLGAGNDLTAVANFLIANNTITTATAARKATTPQNFFTGGALCATPAP